MQYEHNWETNLERMRQYWPKAKYEEYSRELLYRKLSGLNQYYLFEAIEATKCKYYQRTPELHRFLLEYKTIADARAMASEKMGPTRGAEKWFCDWEKPNAFTGIMCTVSSDCPDEASARAHAARLGGRARKHGATSSDPLPKVNLDDYTREQLATAIAVLRGKAWLSAAAMPSDHALWNEHQRGAVEYQLVEQPAAVATEPIADGKWHGIKHARAAIDDDPKRAAEYDRLVADHPALAKIVKAQDDARIQRAAAQKETT